MPEFAVLESLREIGRGEWDACFKGEAESHDYLLAVEGSALKGFKWCYVVARQDGVVVAAMPGFLSDYMLDTTLQGVGKKITNAIKSAFPNLLTLKLACLGSPCTEVGMVGFAGSVAEADRAGLVSSMLGSFEKYAAGKGYKLLGIKDVPEDMDAVWKQGAEKNKYASVSGMPTAYLDIDFADVEEYISRLSYKTRKNMRQKLKSNDAVRIEVRGNIDDVLPRVMALYNETRSRSDWQFEELNESFFKGVLANMPGRAFCVLYYAGEKLLAANLLVCNDDVLVDKFFCMDNEGRDYNLYFLSWFNNITYCLQKGLKCYQSGQANYENKIRLGSKLRRNSMYFKHRNIIAQGVLKLVAPLLAADDTVQEAA